MTLNRDFILNTWAPALRSGKYEQVAGHLRWDTQYCCLGVACDLYIGKLWAGEWIRDIDSDLFVFDDGTFSAESFLSERVRQFIGFEKPAGPPVTIDGVAYDSLAEANDAGRTFEQIADALEAIAR